MHRSRIATLSLVLTLAASLPALASTQNTIKRNFKVAEGGTLTLEADTGDIRITTGAGDGVTIDILRTARTSDRAKADDLFRDHPVAFDQQGNDLHVTGKDERNHGFSFFNWGNDFDAVYNVTVPPHYNVVLSTAGGDIKVADLHGTVTCRTSGGNINLGTIDGVVTAKTSGGDIVLAGATQKALVHTSGGDIKVGHVSAPVDAKTSGGSISITQVTGDLIAHTSGGNIDIEDALGAVDAHTSGGSITARLAKQPRAESRLATSGGNVTVSIASNVAVDIDAHTSGGEVETDMPVTVIGKQTESSLTGKVNGGGPKLVLRSSGGDVRLRKI